RKTRTPPVGQLKANHWGWCDMQGNVREWCGDWLGEISDKPVTDPIGPIESTGKRLHRGSDCGSWWKDTRREVYNRVGLPPGDKRATIGFRVVLSDE
ncbi:MAG: SUMF1/EgtB/PvdO family nonheme iron enzyme, partial [Kiritimatiellae bacterium]|nr:SUMF1/EgtB/PvdO family nonheme iron enzyme [Kiritimatiellia bacterium]